MDHISYSAELLHKQRAVELQAEARLERFLQERKRRDAIDWRQRRQHRGRKFK